MFAATLATLFVAQPLYGALVSRVTRARFISVVYHFSVANLALFWLLLTAGVATVIVARVFFVWVSVFNLFAVAVFGRSWPISSPASRASACSDSSAPGGRPVRWRVQRSRSAFRYRSARPTCGSRQS